MATNKVTRKMLGAAHDILLKQGLMLSGVILEEIYEAMANEASKNDYFDGDTQDVLLAKIAKLEAALDAKSVLHLDAEKCALKDRIATLEGELDEWRHGERTYPPAKQSYNDMLEYMNWQLSEERVKVSKLEAELAEARKVWNRAQRHGELLAAWWNTGPMIEAPKYVNAAVTFFGRMKKQEQAN